MAQAVPPGDDIYHIDAYRLQQIRTHPYFVDPTTQKAYRLGTEIIGNKAVPVFDMMTNFVPPPAGTRGCLMTEEQWGRYLRDQQLQGTPCIIDPSPRAAGNAGPMAGLPVVVRLPPPIPLPGVAHATIISLQRARSHQYFIDLTASKLYYLGNEVIGNSNAPSPDVDARSHPPDGACGLFVTKSQWDDYCTRGDLFGVFGIVDPPPMAAAAQAEPVAAPLSLPIQPLPNISQATLTSLQNARSRLYFIDLTTGRSYYRGNEIIGNPNAPNPDVNDQSHPPVGACGLLMRQDQWNAYWAQGGLSGEFSSIGRG